MPGPFGRKIGDSRNIGQGYCKTGIMAPVGELAPPLVAITWLSPLAAVGYGAGLAPASLDSGGRDWSSAPSFLSGQMPPQLQDVSVMVNGKPPKRRNPGATACRRAVNAALVVVPLSTVRATGPVVESSGVSTFTCVALT